MTGYFKAAESHNEEMQHCRLSDANSNVTVDGATPMLALAAASFGEITSHAGSDNARKDVALCIWCSIVAL